MVSHRSRKDELAFETGKKDGEDFNINKAHVPVKTNAGSGKLVTHQNMELLYTNHILAMGIYSVISFGLYANYFIGFIAS